MHRGEHPTHQGGTGNLAASGQTSAAGRRTDSAKACRPDGRDRVMGLDGIGWDSIGLVLGFGWDGAGLRRDRMGGVGKG